MPDHEDLVTVQDSTNYSYNAIGAFIVLLVFAYIGKLCVSYYSRVPVKKVKYDDKDYPSYKKKKEKMIGYGDNNNVEMMKEADEPDEIVH